MRQKGESSGRLNAEDLARWAGRDLSEEPSEIARSDMDAIVQKHVDELKAAYFKLINA